MSTTAIAFFNNKGGVGKTSLVYHLAWMYADLGLRVVAADLDPQANLTAAFLDEDQLSELWLAEKPGGTIYQCVKPLIDATGDITSPHLHIADESERLALVVGDLNLSRFEDELSSQWRQCVDGEARPFRVISAFSRTIQRAAAAFEAQLILIDLGPNLGALNRAAMIAADFVTVPLAPDLFSLKGLQNLGPALQTWRQLWAKRIPDNPDQQAIPLPSGRMEPAGYIVLQHGIRLDRPVKAYSNWIARIPETYREYVLQVKDDVNPPVQEDPHCLAMLKHYRSLMPMAQEARKPIFHLKPADGAIGSHLTAVREAEKDFHKLAQVLADRVGVQVPPR